MTPRSKRLPPPIVPTMTSPELTPTLTRQRSPKCASTAATIAPRGVDAAVGVVGQRLGRAEHGQHPVAEELVHAAAVLLDHRHGDAEELVQQRHRLARGDAVGERREVADVDEQQGHHRVLAVHRGLLSHSETWAGWTVSVDDAAQVGAQRLEVDLVAQPRRRTPRASCAAS